jgi:hypothetical protein
LALLLLSLCGLTFFWHWPGRPTDTLVKRKLAGLFHSKERCYVERVCWASQPAIGRKHYKNQRTTPTHRTHTHYIFDHLFFDRKPEI